MLGITLLFFFYNTLILPGKESFSIELTDNQQWVYNLPQLHKHQGYGKMRVGRSVDNNTLRVQDTLYTQGIGSHAPSTVTYKLPKNSRAFDALVAADDESTSASIEFKVMLDTTEVWSSGTMKSGDKKRACHVDIDGHSKITLIISEGSSMSGDHADWLLPRITIEEE